MTTPTWDELRKHVHEDHLAAFDSFVETLESERDELKERVDDKESDLDLLVSEQDAVLTDVKYMLHDYFYGHRNTVSTDDARKLLTKVERVLDEPR